MVAVILGTVVSVGIILLALSVVLHEVQTRWTQIVAALAFDQRTYAPQTMAPLRRPAAPRQTWPAPVRVLARRAA